MDHGKKKMHCYPISGGACGGFIWVVGRREPTSDPLIKADWHIQGIATHENVAIEMCADENYFIGPLPLNTALPHDTIEWVGLYFPLREPKG